MSHTIAFVRSALTIMVKDRKQHFSLLAGMGSLWHRLLPRSVHRSLCMAAVACCFRELRNDTALHKQNFWWY